MISLADARALISDKIKLLPAVTGTLAEAAGHILRRDVRAREDFPAFDRSAVDGYAIGPRGDSDRYQIVAEIQPGAVSKRKLGAGDCARIFTGAPVPPGACQVLMQEDVRVENGFMVPQEKSDTTHIRLRGEDARKGDALLKSGARLNPGDVALLASLGVARPKISPLVRVAHIATGNELIAPENKLRPGLIRDSNSILVAAGARQFGGDLVAQKRLPDDFPLLLKTTRWMISKCDLLLLSGGASVGDHDFGKQLLAALGFKIHFTALNLRPGKPLVFATRGRQAAFVLPGNPVSHLVTLHVAVRLAFDCLTGAAPCWPLVPIPLGENLDHAPNRRETFAPARVVLPDGGGNAVVRPLRWQSSGDVTGLAGVNGLLRLAPGAKAPRAGEPVPVLLLELP